MLNRIQIAMIELLTPFKHDYSASGQYVSIFDDGDNKLIIRDDKTIQLFKNKVIAKPTKDFNDLLRKIINDEPIEAIEGIVHHITEHQLGKSCSCGELFGATEDEINKHVFAMKYIKLLNKLSKELSIESGSNADNIINDLNKLVL